MSAHTPTPWRIDPEFPGDVQSGDGKLEVAACAEGWPDSQLPEVCSADAAHIVRCVNAHDMFVSTLRQIAREDADSNGHFARIAKLALTAAEAS